MLELNILLERGFSPVRWTHVALHIAKLPPIAFWKGQSQFPLMSLRMIMIRWFVSDHLLPAFLHVVIGLPPGHRA